VNGDTRPRIVAGGEYLVVTVPLTMKRRRGRREIIAPANLDPVAPVQPRANTPLALTIARAHRWREALEAGQHASIRELALAVGVDSSYAARILRLTLLAPDIIEAILEGTEPDGLSLEQLYRLPAEWEGQREEAGMPAGRRRGPDVIEG
jgi:hypothetical protein